MKKELTFESVWLEAMTVYKDIKKKSGIPIVKKLLESPDISENKRIYAEEAIKNILV